MLVSPLIIVCHIQCVQFMYTKPPTLPQAPSPTTTIFFRILLWAWDMMFVNKSANNNTELGICKKGLPSRANTLHLAPTSHYRFILCVQNRAPVRNMLKVTQAVPAFEFNICHALHVLQINLNTNASPKCIVADPDEFCPDTDPT